jgi:putative ABC transport system permease protein
VVGLREMRRHKRTFGFIVAVVALIAFLIVMINGLASGLVDEYGSAMERFDADAVAFESGAQTSVLRSSLDESTVRAIENLPGVERAAALTFLQADYRSGSGDSGSAGFMGYDVGTIGEPPVIDGRAIRSGERQVLLADSATLRQAGLAIGDTMRIETSLLEADFTIVGEIDGGSLGFLPVSYMTNEDLRALKYGDAADRGRSASVVILQGAGPFDLRWDGFEVVSHEVAVERIEGRADAQTTMAAAQVMVYLIGAAVIGVFFYILTTQKTSGIGLLKALGAGNRLVAGQILAQVLVVVAVSLAVALPAAKLATDAMARFAPDAIPVTPGLSTYLLTSFAVALTGIVGITFAVRRAVRIDPIVALARQQ